MDDDRIRALLGDLYREGFIDPPPAPTAQVPGERRRAWRWPAAAIVVAAAVAVLVVALTRGDDSVQRLTPVTTPTATAAPTLRAIAQDPLQLVGLWTVHDPRPDAAPRPDRLKVTAVRLGDDLIGFTPCGEYLGSWTADAGGAFVTSSSGGSGACYRGPADDRFVRHLPDWLEKATRYELAGRTEVRLYDAFGALTARLTRGADVGSRPDLARELTLSPTIDAQIRNRLKTARTPGPAGDVSLGEVTGRWVPFPAEPRAPRQPYLQFNRDGSWDGLDGCNGAGGRWLFESGGAVVATQGASTAIGCFGSPVGYWMQEVRTLRLVGGKLRLYDVNARLVGTLVRG